MNLSCPHSEAALSGGSPASTCGKPAEPESALAGYADRDPVRTTSPGPAGRQQWTDRQARVVPGRREARGVSLDPVPEEITQPIVLEPSQWSPQSRGLPRSASDRLIPGLSGWLPLRRSAPPFAERPMQTCGDFASCSNRALASHRLPTISPRAVGGSLARSSYAADRPYFSPVRTPALAIGVVP